METLSYIPDRRSICRFTDQKIDNLIITKILTAAMVALGYARYNSWDLSFASKKPEEL